MRRPDAAQVGLIALAYAVRFTRWWPPLRWIFAIDEYVAVNTTQVGAFVVPTGLCELASKGLWLKELNRG